MRTGLIAAGLALLAAVVLATNGQARRPSVEHTCSAADRQFIAKTQLNMTALGIWSEDYRRGEATAGEVVAEARRAAGRVEALQPSDPSLRQAKVYVAGMFTEYGKGLSAKRKNAASHVYRAYGLANFAHDVLAEAAPALRRRGCDVSSLL